VDDYPQHREPVDPGTYKSCTNPITSSFLLIAGAEKRWGVVDNVSIKDGTLQLQHVEFFQRGDLWRPPPKLAFLPLKMGHPKRKRLSSNLQPAIFRGELVVSGMVYHRLVESKARF